MSAVADLPDPLTPADCDLRDMDGFMLNAERLMASELVAISTGDEFKAAVMLWCRAWKQVPAASLPNDERVLAAFSGAGPRWKKVRAMALRGFVLCNDGRLYHPVLAADATRAAKAKQQRRDAIRKRWDKAPEQPPTPPPNEGPNHDRTYESDTAVIRGPYQGQGQDRTGTLSKKEPKAPHPESTALPDTPADAPAALGGDLVKAGDACLEACGLDPTRFTGNFQPVAKWQRAGLSLDRDILPTIAEITRQRRLNNPDWRPGSLGYFDKAMAELKPADAPAKPVNPLDQARAYVRMLDRGQWPAGLGPSPGQPGSPVTAEQLAQVRAEQRGAAA